MITEAELRVGNMYHHNDQWSYMDKGYAYDFEWSMSDAYQVGECCLFLENVSGIDLTEARFIGLGGTIDWNKCGRCEIGKMKGTWNKEHGFWPDNLLPVKQIHDLQNLYYGIYKEELPKNK